MLAKDYDGQDVTGWLISEKLDGVRAIWDGKALWTRNGNRINAPEYFTANLPKIALDGELWLGRGRFQEMVSILRKRGADWSGVSFLAFDAPEESGGFSERLKKASEVCEIVPHFVCKSTDDMWQRFDSIVEDGGEGVMLRDPSAPYFTSRSGAMLKLKGCMMDEAEVFAIDGASLVCRWRGVEFRIASGVDRDDMPPVGSTVTFACCGLTDQGTPRHASFVEVRDYE